jgi:16S rRNA processing protein RimM
MGPVGRLPGSAARPEEATPLVELGRIVHRHGVRGELRVLSYNPDSETPFAVPYVILCDADGGRARFRVATARRHKKFVLLRLEGISTAEQAESLVGRTVAVRHEDLPPPGADEVYHVDLIGCAVRTDGGEELGTVREMIATGSNDVCVVRGRGREHLIPLVGDVIERIDLVHREIVVRPVPGLLET